MNASVPRTRVEARRRLRSSVLGLVSLLVTPSLTPPASEAQGSARRGASAAVELCGRILVDHLQSGEGLGGVQLEAEGALGPDVSEDGGFFRLRFPTKDPGDQVEIAVHKDGWALVNPERTIQNLPKPGSACGIRIVMALEVEREEWARRYYRHLIGDKIESNYEKRINELEDELLRGRLTQDQLDKERTELEAELEQLRGQVDVMAGDFATRDRSSVLPLYEQALDLFVQDEVDAALALLDKAELETRLEEKKRELQQIAEGFTLKASIHASRFEPDLAVRYLQRAVEADSNGYQARYDLALYLQDLNRKQEAENVYSGLIAGELETPRRAHVLNNLGLLYADTLRAAEAEQAYQEALELWQTLAQGQAETYDPDLARVLGNLGNLYVATGRHAKAEQAYQQVLQLYRALHEHQPERYESDLARTLNNLGNLYAEAGRHADAERALEEALQLRQAEAQGKHLAYDPNLAMTLNSLAILYADTGRHADAEQAYDESVRIWQILARYQPQSYEPDLAMTLNNLGTLYVATARPTDAQQAYDEALELYKPLALRQPQAYQPNLAMVLYNLGILYGQTDRHADAEQAFGEALQLYRTLSRRQPQTYQPDLAATLSGLGVLYARTGRHAEAERALEEAWELQQTLVHRLPGTQEPVLAMTLNSLGNLYADTGRPADADRVYREALQLRQTLAQHQPQTYCGPLAETLFNLGLVHSKQNRHAAAQLAWREALDVLRTLKESGGALPPGLLPDLVGSLSMSYEAANDLEGLAWLEEHYGEIAQTMPRE